MQVSHLPAAALASCSMVAVQGWSAGRPVQRQDCVAQEAPVALVFNGVSHAVMMATPDALEDFALGFALSEGIVDRADQVYGMEVEASDKGYTLQIDIAAACFARLKDMRRALTGRTGCGLCGAESLEQALRLPAPVPAGAGVAPPAIARAMGDLRQRQRLLHLTGATHAAAWCTPQGDITLLREDVGRHNALDKLIGAMARAGCAADQGFVAVTSRASYEMVQKAAHAGVGLLAAVSGVTGLAIEVAERCGLCLLGFVRGTDFNVYTHPRRVLWKAR
ncbi:MAG: formate dehydrogenase accessory sulfurtransferase FdhD [Proteobacteria bacterium]|nr:formate dehydrogenase accessory sulfurtransferase FdhD [Pseudomonadota bacterium]